MALEEQLAPPDVVLGTHRSHGHYIAAGGRIEELVWEVLGRSTGAAGGVGGSQHLYVGDGSRHRFLSNGVQGGMTPIAVGIGLGQKWAKSGGISVCVIGDGTLGAGVVYESFNLARVLACPVLYVLEDNGYAQSTRTDTTTSGSVRGRCEAFGLQLFETNTWDLENIFDRTRSAFEFVRGSELPAVLHIRTDRLMAHSKGDDMRPPEEMREYWNRDLVRRFQSANPDLSAAISERMSQRLRAALTQPDELETQPDEFEPSGANEGRNRDANLLTWRSWLPAEGKGIDAVHAALNHLLESQSDSVLLGEDLAAPYGGAFKATRDLSVRFPDQVICTPISEPAIVGCASGLALMGRTAVVEIMFGDFLTLTIDQLVQHAAKFVTMYGREIRVPLIVRTPMGGRRGYGPTHSQSIERLLLGVADLDVIALNSRANLQETYCTVLDTVERPTLVLENKLLYTRDLSVPPPPGYVAQVTNQSLPTARLRPVGMTAHATVACYGGMLDEVERCLTGLFASYEVAVEVVAPTQLHPIDVAGIVESVKRTGLLLIPEEGPSFAAWGSEVVARLREAGLEFRVARTGLEGVVPASRRLELQTLGDAATLTTWIAEAINWAK